MSRLVAAACAIVLAGVMVLTVLTAVEALRVIVDAGWPGWVAAALVVPPFTAFAAAVILDTLASWTDRGARR